MASRLSEQAPAAKASANPATMIDQWRDAIRRQESVRFNVEIVVEGNLAKFGQDAALRSYLVSTGSRVLVEASPQDRIWGIGLVASLTLFLRFDQADNALQALDVALDMIDSRTFDDRIQLVEYRPTLLEHPPLGPDPTA